MTHLLLIIALLLTSFAALHAAELKLAASFSRQMVFQREMPVPVWGWSTPQSELTAAFKSQRMTTRTVADGRWRVALVRTSGNLISIGMIFIGRNPGP